MIYDPGLLVISLVFMGIGMLISSRLKNKFEQYSRERLSSGLSGREVAEKMLWENGIYDVKVQSVAGMLTDHYDPTKKIVNLSEAVYQGVTVASAAVAAHECGHAVQHKTAYQWLNLRSKLVPAVNIASSGMTILTSILFFLAYFSPAMTNAMLLIFIVLQSAITIFSLITLPVEIDASKRALAWLDRSGITHNFEHRDAKDALTWAAYTYIASALGSVATLFYFIWRFVGNSRSSD